MKRRHQRPAVGCLDLGALHVHRDIQHSARRAEDKQRRCKQGERRRVRQDRQHRAIHHCGQSSNASATRTAYEPTRDRHSHNCAERQPEESHSELSRTQRKPLLHCRNHRQPRGQRPTVDEEHRKDRSARRAQSMRTLGSRHPQCGHGIASTALPGGSHGSVRRRCSTTAKTKRWRANRATLECGVHRFSLEEVFQALRAELAAPAGFLVAAGGHGDVRKTVNVDADAASFDGSGNAMRLVSTISPL